MFLQTLVGMILVSGCLSRARAEDFLGDYSQPNSGSYSQVRYTNPKRNPTYDAYNLAYNPALANHRLQSKPDQPLQVPSFVVGQRKPPGPDDINSGLHAITSPVGAEVQSAVQDAIQQEAQQDGMPHFAATTPPATANPNAGQESLFVSFMHNLAGAGDTLPSFASVPSSVSSSSHESVELHSLPSQMQPMIVPIGTDSIGGSEAVEAGHHETVAHAESVSEADYHEAAHGSRVSGSGVASHNNAERPASNLTPPLSQNQYIMFNGQDQGHHLVGSSMNFDPSGYPVPVSTDPASEHEEEEEDVEEEDGEDYVTTTEAIPTQPNHPRQGYPVLGPFISQGNGQFFHAGQFMGQNVPVYSPVPNAPPNPANFFFGHPPHLSHGEYPAVSTSNMTNEQVDDNLINRRVDAVNTPPPTTTTDCPECRLFREELRKSQQQMHQTEPPRPTHENELFHQNNEDKNIITKPPERLVVVPGPMPISQHELDQEHHESQKEEQSQEHLANFSAPLSNEVFSISDAVIPQAAPPSFPNNETRTAPLNNVFPQNVPQNTFTPQMQPPQMGQGVQHGPNMPHGPMQPPMQPGNQMQGGPMNPPMPGSQIQGGPMNPPMPGPQMQGGPMQPPMLGPHVPGSPLPNHLSGPVHVSQLPVPGSGQTVPSNDGHPAPGQILPQMPGLLSPPGMQAFQPGKQGNVFMSPQGPVVMNHQMLHHNNAPLPGMQGIPPPPMQGVPMFHSSMGQNQPILLPHPPPPNQAMSNNSSESIPMGFNPSPQETSNVMKVQMPPHNLDKAQSQGGNPVLMGPQGPIFPNFGPPPPPGPNSMMRPPNPSNLPPRDQPPPSSNSGGAAAGIPGPMGIVIPIPPKTVSAENVVHFHHHQSEPTPPPRRSGLWSSFLNALTGRNPHARSLGGFDTFVVGNISLSNDTVENIEQSVEDAIVEEILEANNQTTENKTDDSHERRRRSSSVSGTFTDLFEQLPNIFTQVAHRFQESAKHVSSRLSLLPALRTFVTKTKVMRFLYVPTNDTEDSQSLFFGSTTATPSDVKDKEMSKNHLDTIQQFMSAKAGALDNKIHKLLSKYQGDSNVPKCAAEAGGSFCAEDKFYPRELLATMINKLSKLGAKLQCNQSTIFDQEKKTRESDDKPSAPGCLSPVQVIHPLRAQNKHKVWKIIVNFGTCQQPVTIQKCHPSCVESNNINRRCQQQEITYTLLAYDSQRKFHVDEFEFPSACICSN